MFYSHEILTNQKYGVATVWLVSTIGLKTTNRKVTRRAIQEVDVRGACGTILKPGAPIALRLQGNLLFGVSRVYDRQCAYVLSDAEKVQGHLRAFHSAALDGNALDPSAGKTKRDNIILLDDPNFDLDARLPAFIHLDDDGNLVLPQESQASRKTSSQLSPLMGDNSTNSASMGGSFLGGFDLPGSHSSQPPMKQPGSIELHGLEGPMIVAEQEEELVQEFDDWGIEIDAEGNIIETVAEPELPKLPRQDQNLEAVHQEEASQALDNDGDIIMDFEGPALPDAEAFPPRQELEIEESEDVAGSQGAVAPAQRRRRRNPIAPDEETTLSRKTIKAWGEDYLANIERARNRTRRSTTAAQARNNAYHLIFGRGIMDVGIPVARPNLVLPLAEHFAGRQLEALIFGDTPSETVKTPRGRRRLALEALELEDEDAERRVRPRLSAHIEQAGQGDGLPVADNARGLRDYEDDIEMGRDDVEALPDIHSDVPWNRPSSQIPSSSIKVGRHGSSRQVSPSPLRAQGSQLFDVEHFSDQPAFGSGDFGGAMYSANNSFSDGVEGGGLIPLQEARTSQAMEQALGREGRNFFTFVQTAARKKGAMREDGKTWVEFDNLFEPEDQSRAVITQAFYHMLSLATRDAIKVEQDGQNDYPFGAIRLGVQQPLQEIEREEDIGDEA